MPIIIVAAGLLGLAVGSFLNVLVYRAPRGESLSHPGSHCPHCHTAIRARHNVPVLSWLALRGKCADCAGAISLRYPLVELTTALLFVATTFGLDQLHLLVALPAYLLLVATCIALAAIDLDKTSLPNAVITPVYVVLTALLTGAALLEGSLAPLGRAGIGAALFLALFFAVAISRPGGVVSTDLRVAGLVGAGLGFVSYPALAVGVGAALVLGVLLGGVLIIGRRPDRRRLLAPRQRRMSADSEPSL